METQKNDESLPSLKPDQVDALSYLPQVIAIINELNELMPLFKKLDQADTESIANQHRKYKADLQEVERAKRIAIKQSYEKGLTDGRNDTKILTSFLKYASYLRESPSEIDGENQAAEDVLIGVYQGGEKGALVAQKLAEGSSELVGTNDKLTCILLWGVVTNDCRCAS